MDTSSPMSKRKLIVVLFIVIGIFLFILITVLSIVKTSSPAYVSTTVSQTWIAQTNAPTPVPPTSTPEPTPTFDSHQLLIQNISDALGAGNREQPRLVQVVFDTPDVGGLYIQWSINDNLTDGMVISGAKYDTIEILKALSISQFDYTTVVLSGYFPIVDIYGQSREENVVTLHYDRYIVGSIDWMNVPVDTIYLTANEKTINALFE